MTTGKKAQFVGDQVRSNVKRKVETKLAGCVAEFNKLRATPTVNVAELKEIIAEAKPAEPLRVDATELCKRLGISPRTLDRWVARRRIPFEKIGRVLKFEVAAVDAALKKFRRNAAGD
jgi:excisionase family DNA binding protein